MKWTLGLFLVAAAGCGYHQTKMVACPETGCAQSYAAASPEGLRSPSPTPTAPAPVVSPPLAPPPAPLVEPVPMPAPTP